MDSTYCRKDPKTGKIKMTVLLEFDGDFLPNGNEQIAEEMRAREESIFNQMKIHLSHYRTLQGKESMK